MKPISTGLLLLIALSSYSQEFTPSFIALSVKNIEAQQKWYCDNLGFKIRRPIATVAPGIRFGLLEGNGIQIELIEDKKSVRSSSDGPVPQGIFKFGFTVPDFDKLIPMLAGKGIKPKYGPFKANATDAANLIVEDPEGNLVQFFGSR
jgi:extradiol dioxygenase family protein